MRTFTLILIFIILIKFFLYFSCWFSCGLHVGFLMVNTCTNTWLFVVYNQQHHKKHIYDYFYHTSRLVVYHEYGQTHLSYLFQLIQQENESKSNFQVQFYSYKLLKNQLLSSHYSGYWIRAVSGGNEFLVRFFLKATDPNISWMSA